MSETLIHVRSKNTNAEFLLENLFLITVRKVTQGVIINNETHPEVFHSRGF